MWKEGGAFLYLLYIYFFALRCRRAAHTGTQMEAKSELAEELLVAYDNWLWILLTFSVKPRSISNFKSSCSAAR